MLLAACGGSNPQQTPDAGVRDTALPDTTVPGEALFACTPSGSVGAVIVDGPTSSAPIDVIFLVHDRAGAVVSTSGLMGSDATAVLDVPACGMVTTVDADSFGIRIFTWVNVQRGDHLVHINRSMPALAHDLAVQLPALATATDYDVIATCSPSHTTYASRSSAGTVMLSLQCSNSMVSIVATAKTPTSSPLAVITVPLAASGTTTIVVPGYATPPASTAAFDGFTELTTASFATFTTPSGNALLVGSPDSGAFVAGGLTLHGAVVTGAGGVEMRVDTIVTGAPTHHSLLARGEAAIPSTVDFSPADILPEITATLSTSGRPTVTWSTAAPVQGAATLFEIHPAAGSQYEWDLVAPATPGAVPFPDLPASLWASTAPVLTGASIFESSTLTTYNANNLSTILERFPAPGTQIRFATQEQSSSALTRRIRASR